MKQTCAECGEELFGAVNRCWKCGTAIVVAYTASVPPIRRRPVDLSSPSASTPFPVVQQTLPFATRLALSDKGRRRCATTSVVLGALGCLLGIATGWTIVLAVLGIAFGVLGMPEKDRDLATIGLVLSVIALFLGFWQIGYGIWIRYVTRRWLDDLQGIP